MVTILQGVSQGQAAVGATTTDGGGATPTFTPPAQPTQPTQQGQQPAVVQRNPNNAVTPRSAAETGESSVDIQADPNTNALIITAPPDEMQNILAVVRQLDIRRAQVTDSDAPVGFSNLGGATDGALGIAGALETGLPPASLGAGLSLALGRFGSGEIDFGFLVRAIASDADNNILSTPSIVTLDNEEAEIIVGENVPFVTGQQLSTNNDNPFQTVERQDIGLTLKVKPQINDGNTIKMELEQEVSSVNPTAVTGAADITTSKRSIKTTVLVDDGQTLVLGGLIDDQISDVEEKVPLLGDIPILGRLFRFRTTTKNKQNLMIFLHPVILRDNDSATQLSNSKYNSLRSRQRFFQQQKNNSISKEEQELPELKLFFEGRHIIGPQTSLDAPVSPDQSIAKLADGTAVKGLSVAGGNTAPEPADIEQVISAYNAKQADEILAADPVEAETTDKADLPAIYLQLAESITAAAVVPAAVATVEQPPATPVDLEEQQPDAVIAEAPSEDESLQEIPASSRSKDLDGVSVTFSVEDDNIAADEIAPATVEPVVEEPVAEVTDLVVEDNITADVDHVAVAQAMDELLAQLATAEPAIEEQAANAELLVENNNDNLADEVDHAAVADAMDELLAELTTAEPVEEEQIVEVAEVELAVEDNDALAEDLDLATVEPIIEEQTAEIATAELVVEDNDAVADDLELPTAEPIVEEQIVEIAAVELVVEDSVAIVDGEPELTTVESISAAQITEVETVELIVEDNDALADDFDLAAAETVTDELLIEEAPAEPVVDELLFEETTSDEEILETVVTTPLPAEYVDNIDSDIVDRSQDKLDDDRPEVVILSVKANSKAKAAKAANDFDINEFWEMQRAPRY